MTIVEQLLEALSDIAAGARPRAITGRVIDQTGTPQVGAVVRILATGVFSGNQMTRAVTNERGQFAVTGIAVPEYVIAIEAGSGTRAIFEDRPAPLALGDLLVTVPLLLTASVGDQADNRPHDVARIQDRLHRLGRLSAEDVSAEPIVRGAVGPVRPGPRLMAAIAAHMTNYFGRPLPVIRIDRDGPTLEAFATDPPFPRTQIAMAAAVGELPGRDAAAALNLAPSVALVQERLHQLGLLNDANRRAELVDMTAANVDLTTIPETLRAIVALETQQTGGSLRAIVPGAQNERALNDPCLAGRRSVWLSATVGTRGTNRRVDVRRVQDRLLALGFLTAAQRTAERPPLQAPSGSPPNVPDASLTQTIAAIGRFQQTRLGEPATVPALIDPVHATLQRINRPPKLELTSSVGWGPSIAAANRPPDVRRLQDRLLLLGFLSQTGYSAERADPEAVDRIDQSLVQQTSVALALASEHRGRLALSASVGSGGVNKPAELRAVQDRLHGVRFLSDADYQQERVDPAEAAVDPTSLPATFAAIAQVRRRIFECPAAAADAPWTAHPIIEVDDETHRFLNDPLFYGRYPLALDGSVGTLGWNFPADVRAVQERLRTMRLLSAADFATERVDPLDRRRSSDLELVATREAIRRLRQSLLGETAPVVERIEVRSEAVVALENALGTVRVPMEMTASVGWNGTNEPADVAQVQKRLHALGYLSDASFSLESQATPATGETRLRDYQIVETIAAIESFQRLLFQGAAEPRIEPFSELQSALAWPGLPRQQDLTLGASVGRTGRNECADVRTVQDRLFELGLLNRRDYFTERVDAAAAGSVADAALPETIAAIGRLQETLAGLALSLPDFLIDPGGRSANVLSKPAWSTPTSPNPNCTLKEAAPARPVFADVNLMRTINAIEAEEGGVSTGEIPAILRNASGTPTSWGAAQVIGGTAVGVLNTADYATFAAFYGLDGPTLTRLNLIATETTAAFDAVTAAVAAGTSEAALQAQIAAYIVNNQALVRANTGLGPGDIARMFRAAQLRSHLLALGAAGDERTLFDPARNPAAAANIAALGLSLSDVWTYLRNEFYNEHRQGFVTRALFLSPEGQTIRNLLTDDSGAKIGRCVIRTNWDLTPAVLAARDRAQITAFMHNRGGNAVALAGQLAMVAANAYVQRVIARYDNP